MDDGQEVDPERHPESVIRLVEVRRDGTPAEPLALPRAAAGVLASTAALYARAGYTPPWIGYLGVDGDACVGACAFTTVPTDGRVAIAYYTFPGLEGRGYATAMARALIGIASAAQPPLLVIAHTLPQPSASTHILGKLGFALVGTAKDPDEGLVWEWHRF